MRTLQWRVEIKSSSYYIFSKKWMDLNNNQKHNSEQMSRSIVSIV